MATERLQLTTAARRFYTEDGTQILDTQDLIKWAVQFYRRQLGKSGDSGKHLKSNNQIKKLAFLINFDKIMY